MYERLSRKCAAFAVLQLAANECRARFVISRAFNAGYSEPVFRVYRMAKLRCNVACHILGKYHESKIIDRR